MRHSRAVTRLLVLIPLLAACLCLTACRTTPVVIASGGEPFVAIVTAKDAPKTVQFAAEELRDHLNRMTGGKFVITNAMPENGDAIVLGDTPQARAVGIDAMKIARDGYAIKSVGNTILIAGRDDSKVDVRKRLAAFGPKVGREGLKRAISPDMWAFERGTLYGVYRFLEELGVRWFFPGPKGTIVPTRVTVLIQPIDIREEPAFLFRGLGSSRWFPRLMNSKSVVDMQEYRDLGWTGMTDRLWRIRQRVHTKPLPLNHRPPRVGFDERFGKDHPEYYALLRDGRRDVNLKKRGYRSHLCYTHPGVMRETIGDLEAFLDGKHARERGIPDSATARYPLNRGWAPGIAFDNIVSVLPHDSFTACHCPTCKPFLKANQPYLRQNSALVWQFVERLGHEMLKRRPDALITCLAYSSYSEVPDGQRPLPPNVIVGLCPGVLNKPHNLTNPKKYAQLMGLVKRWDRVAEGPLAYWFHHLYRHRRPEHFGVPVHIPHLTQRLFRDLAKRGKWMYMQQDGDAAMFEVFNRYMMARLLYNPEQDVSAMLDDYVTRLYGPEAGPIIRAIYDDIGKRGPEAFKRNAGRIGLWEEHFPEKVIKGYRAWIDRAVTLTKDTPHADAVALFSKYYVGLMEQGYARYAKNVRAALKSGRADIIIHRAKSPIRIDGVLDEPAWKVSTVRRGFHNNVDSAVARPPTELRLLYTPKVLYFAFTCFAPNMKALADQGKFKDSIEIFLDTNHDRDSFYQILINPDGTVRDWHFESTMELPLASWRSMAKVKVKRLKDRWVAEVAVPRATMDDGLKMTKSRTWGANFCRSVTNPPTDKDRFTTFSPLLRGRFKQPDLFGILHFEK